MKFGKQIQFQQIPEWQSHYMSYKGLKKIINSLIQEKAQISVTIAASPPPGSEPAPLPEDENSTLLQSQKAAFFFKLERELEKVNSFYLQKESELKVRLRSLIDKKKVILARQGRPGTSSSINSLKEAFRQFEQDLNKLQKFVETNGTGFRKILKKWDKRSKSTTKELYLARQVDLQPCFNQDAMVELADSAAHHLLALEDIQQRRPSSTPSSPITAKSGQPTQAIAPSSPVQQQMDEIESDLFNALITSRSSVVQEILDRRLKASNVAQTTQSESEPRQDTSGSLLAPEHAREVISRVFWRCCSEVGASDSVIQQLVDTGLINFKFVDDISDRTCLHEAAMVGRLFLLQLCVSNGVSPECMDVYGRRPLHYISMYGYADCATYLLSLGASMTATDHDGFRPLIYSVMNGHTKCVEIFLANNVEIEASKEGDPIPLSLACHYGHEDIAMMLIGRGANVRACNADGLEPLHITCREGHTRLAKTLAARGARPDQEDKYMCWTPLFYAASEGHVDCVRILLEAGCNVNVLDEHDKTPIYYAASEGHADCVALLVNAGGKAEGKTLGLPVDTDMETPPPLTLSDMLSSSELPPMDSGHTTSDSIASPTNMDDLDMDLIPSLSLPPPIIPFRIYGHNYLDQKYQINLTLGHVSPDPNGTQKAPVHLYGTAQISSLKLVISSRPDNGMIPHNVILPLGDNRKVYGFQVDTLDQFTLEFNIFPTFGSKTIGRAVALPSTFSSPALSVGKGVLPLFDAYLKVVGELAFDIDSTIIAVTTPLAGTPSLMPVSTSTSRGALPTPASQTTLSGNTIPSYITASSLSGEYIQLSVQMTRDFVPVIFANWRLPVEGFDLALSDVTFSQFKRFGNLLHKDISEEDLENGNSRLSSGWRSSEWRRKVYERWMSLEQVLRILPKHIGVNLELKYPTMSEKRHYRLNNTVEFNKFVDTILQTAYDSSSSTHHRSFVYSSFNPVVCSALNWKQPNYAVFFCTYGGYNKGPVMRTPSIEEQGLTGLKRREPMDPEVLPSSKHGSATALPSNLSDARGPSSRASSVTITSTPTSGMNSPSLSHSSVCDTATTSVPFQETDRRCTSIKEAIKFARSNNLLGVICEATPLIQVPSLITHIKESGLILTSFGISNKDPALVQIQKNHGVDALMFMDSNGDEALQDRNKAGVGLGLMAESSRNTRPSKVLSVEVEEGVLRYQNGVDSGSLGI
ncbi:phosphate system positive regulatory protein pho81 [Mortierella polycephala]|uniref:Phosphate system positive regulatory protein pho81 n=1 Tax=Mortierella polycephala TaxID=41804 RepID=A0A9P6PTE9_9FUNG|nr:phosphate system positive regulatory protein pho81 [Mortierella polycephala]